MAALTLGGAGSGRVLAELFVKLPSARDYPDYYEVVAEPIDLKSIRVPCHRRH
jgi:hypothetical protein